MCCHAQSVITFYVGVFCEEHSLPLTLTLTPTRFQLMMTLRPTQNQTQLRSGETLKLVTAVD